jgi:hypothetical protein
MQLLEKLKNEVAQSHSKLFKVAQKTQLLNVASKTQLLKVGQSRSKLLKITKSCLKSAVAESCSAGKR